MSGRLAPCLPIVQVSPVPDVPDRLFDPTYLVKPPVGRRNFSHTGANRTNPTSGQELNIAVGAELMCLVPQSEDTEAELPLLRHKAEPLETTVSGEEACQGGPDLDLESNNATGGKGIVFRMVS